MQLPYLPDPGLLEQALWHVREHHDALRARFTCDESGWHQTIVAPDGIPNAFTYIDLEEVSGEQRETVLAFAKTEVNRSMDLEQGPLMRMALFGFGSDKPCQIFTSIHHVVLDAVSNQIVSEDLQTAYLHLLQGEQVQLPAKTSSFKTWGERLYTYAGSPMFDQQLSDALALPWMEVPPLPMDYLGKRKMRWDSEAVVSQSLSAEETRILVRGLPRIFQCQVIDAVTLGLVQAVTDWTGGQWMCLGVDDARRMLPIPQMEDLDMSRTVGYLAGRALFLYERPGTNDPAQALKSIHTQRQRFPFPQLGVMLGFLRMLDRYPGDDLFPAYVRHSVALTYYGEGTRRRALARPDLFDPALLSEGYRKDGSGAATRSQELVCLVSVADEGLAIRMNFGKNMFEPGTVERVARGFVDTLRSLVGAIESV